MSSEAVKATMKAVALMHSDLVRNSFSGKVTRSGMFYQSAPGNSLAARTGATKGRLVADVLVRGNAVFGIVGSPDKHVLANENGATIRPKTAKMLAIPTKNIQTPTGALKAEWASKLAGSGWRGIWKQEKLFVIRKNAGGLGGGWIARKVGPPTRGKGGKFKSGKVELLAYLTPSVHLAARKMFKTSARRVSSAVAAIISSGIETVMRGKK